jgi:hypothetical protein
MDAGGKRSAARLLKRLLICMCMLYVHVISCYMCMLCVYVYILLDIMNKESNP